MEHSIVKSSQDNFMRSKEDNDGSPQGHDKLDNYTYILQNQERAVKTVEWKSNRRKTAAKLANSQAFQGPLKLREVRSPELSAK